MPWMTRKLVARALGNERTAMLCIRARQVSARGEPGREGQGILDSVEVAASQNGLRYGDWEFGGAIAVVIVSAQKEAKIKVSKLLHEFGPAIWISNGPIVSFYGFGYPTRMALIKLSDGGLFVWSPVLLSAALKRDIDALGPVHFLISPNRLHHLFLAEWKSAYPQARLYASPGLRKKRKDLVFDAELDDRPEPEWATDIDQVPVRGSLLTEVEFFHRASRTAIFADLIQNLRRDWFKGWRGVAARLDGICDPNPGAPREWRASFINRRAARAALERILAWPIERVLIAHGEPATTNGAAFVRHAFAWLIGRDQLERRS